MMDERERRSAERRPELGAVFIEVMAKPEGPGPQERILISNTMEISMGGLRVHLDEAVEKNAMLQIAVKLGQLDTSMYLVGEVRWCVPASDGKGYEAGFALLESEGTDLKIWRTLVRAINRR